MSRKISELTELSAPADDDYFEVTDTSAGQSKKIKHSNLNPGEKSTTVTSDYTVTKDREVVFCSGTLTVTLAAASNAFKASIANVGTGTVTITCAAGDYIEGVSSIVLGRQYESVVLKANGAGVYVIFG